MLRAKFVRPGGPPITSNRRLPAVLSLCSIAAAHKAPRVMPPSSRCAFVIGAYSRRSFELYPYEPLQIVFSLVHSLQDRRGREKFKRAAHRETFLQSIIEALAVAGIQRCYGDSTTSSRFDRRNPILEMTCSRRCACRRG